MDEEIKRKLENIEQHIVNLNASLEDICKVLRSPNDINFLIKQLRQPIEINNGPLINMLRPFEEKMRTFSSDIKKLEELNLIHSLAEMKYIGEKVHKIEKTLSEMEKKGIEKKIDLKFQVDGYELVKKPLHYDRTEQIDNSEHDKINVILDHLDERYAQTVIHRLGLYKEKKKTFDQLGKILKVSKERAREIYQKALRLLRSQKTIELVNNCGNMDLILAVTRKCD